MAARDWGISLDVRRLRVLSNISNEYGDEFYPYVRAPRVIDIELVRSGSVYREQREQRDLILQAPSCIVRINATIISNQEAGPKDSPDGPSGHLHQLELYSHRRRR